MQYYEKARNGVTVQVWCRHRTANGMLATKRDRFLYSASSLSISDEKKPNKVKAFFGSVFRRKKH